MLVITDPSYFGGSDGSVFDSDLIDAGTDLSKIGLKHFDAADTIYISPPRKPTASAVG